MLRQMPQVEGFRLFRNGIFILDKGVLLIQIDIGKVSTFYRPVGVSSPVISLSKVVLPLPLSPLMQNRLPLRS